MVTIAVTGLLILGKSVFILGSDQISGKTRSSGLPFQALPSVYGACLALTRWHLLPLLPVTEYHLLLAIASAERSGETLAHPWALPGAVQFPGILEVWRKNIC